MKSRSLILCCCTVLLLLNAVSPLAFANTGTCGSTPQTSCPSGYYQCATDGSTCQVSVQRNGAGGVNLVVNGTTYTGVCAKPGTPFEWLVRDPNATSFADIRFDTTNYPFPQSSILADSNNAASTTLGVSLNYSCYSFAIADCPAAAGGSCGYSDPRVVIYPPTLRMLRLHRDMDHDKDDMKDKEDMKKEKQ